MLEERQQRRDTNRDLYLTWMQAHTVRINNVLYCAVESLSREMTTGSVLIGKPRHPSSVIKQRLIHPCALYAHFVTVVDVPRDRAYAIVCAVDSIESLLGEFNVDIIHEMVRVAS